VPRGTGAPLRHVESLFRKGVPEKELRRICLLSAPAIWPMLSSSPPLRRETRTTTKAAGCSTTERGGEMFSPRKGASCVQTLLDVMSGVGGVHREDTQGDCDRGSFEEAHR
jgi:hypothetical protein